MNGRPLLWFALGIVFTVSLGATILRNEGIEFPDGSVQTTAATGAREFYLTSFTTGGGGALAACASGFHMASLFEILDPSNLRYAFDHVDAATQSDSGMGPPSDLFGWVRTGEKAPLETEAEPGEASCDVWTTSDVAVNGTRMELEDKWLTIPTNAEIGPWDIELETCDDPFAETGVWCVAD